MNKNSAWSVLSLQVAEETLHTGEQKRWYFHLPAHPTLILLSVEAHIDWPNPAGAAYIMELRVNGEAIASPGRLINKPTSFHYADGRWFEYYGSIQEITSLSQWLVFYSPDYDSNNLPSSPYQVMEGQPSLYIFDITDMIYSGQTENITLGNDSEAYSWTVPEPLSLKFRNIKLLIREQY